MKIVYSHFLYTFFFSPVVCARGILVREFELSVSVSLVARHGLTIRLLCARFNERLGSGAIILMNKWHESKLDSECVRESRNSLMAKLCIIKLVEGISTTLTTAICNENELETNVKNA
jgi:hypothetical protein